MTTPAVCGVDIFLPRFCFEVPKRKGNEFQNDPKYPNLPTPAHFLAKAYGQPLSYYRLDIRLSDREEILYTVFTDKWGEIRAVLAGKTTITQPPFCFLIATREFKVRIAPYEPMKYPGKASRLWALRAPRKKGSPKTHWVDAKVRPDLSGQHRDLCRAVDEWAKKNAANVSSKEAEWALPRLNPAAIPVLIPRPEAKRAIRVGTAEVDIGWPVVRWDQKGSDESVYAGRYDSPFGPAQKAYSRGALLWRFDSDRKKKGLPPSRYKQLLPQTVLRDSGEIRGLLLHFDQFRCSGDAAAILTGKTLSSHFLIDNDGTIYQILDPSFTAAHAGVGEENQHCLAVDLCNPAYDEAAEETNARWYGAQDCMGESIELRSYFTDVYMQSVVPTVEGAARLSGHLDNFLCQYRAVAHLLAGLHLALGVGFEYLNERSRDLNGKLILENLPEARRKTQEKARTANLEARKVHDKTIQWGQWPRLPEKEPSPLYVRITKESPKMKLDEATGKTEPVLDPKGKPEHDVEHIVSFRGSMHHYNVRDNRFDAGPLFHWEKLMELAQDALGKVYIVGELSDLEIQDLQERDPYNPEWNQCLGEESP